MAVLAPPFTLNTLRGIDTTTPYDMLQKGRSPFAKNFRLYAEQADDRRVAVTNRKGSQRYSVPIGEANSASNTSTTGASDASISTISQWLAMPFVPTKTGPLTKVELNLKDVSLGQGPVVVEIYSNNSGVPGTKLADSGILESSITSSYQYLPAYFAEAPTVTNAVQYWVVAYVQDDGANGYSWSSNTASTLSMRSNTTGSSWAANTYSLNFKAYVADPVSVYGLTRYAPSNSVNKTLAPIGTTMYTVDDVTGATTAIYTGLNAQATQYHFGYADDKVFWVNSFDNLLTWDGSSTASNSELATNGTFEVNTTGWTAGTGNVMTRDTVTFRTGVASMKLVASGGNVAASTFAYTFTVNKQYTLSAYVNGTVGQQVQLTASGQTSTAVTLVAGWNLVTFTFFATTASSTYGVKSVSTNQTIYTDDVSLKFTGIEQITHAQLPILSDFVFHKNRLMGVSAADPNKTVWSEEPGNSDGAGNLWYKAYLSTSFIYIPTSKASDPITGLVSFQDTLVVFTRGGKWALYGSNPGDYVVRQAMGRHGAVAPNAIYADESYIYFVGTDGIYRYNGSSDDLISDRIQNEFSKIGDIDKIAITKWQRQVRFYYPGSAQAVNNQTVIWHTALEEWLLDTDTYVSRAVAWLDGDDPYELIQASSTSPALFYAEKQDSEAGKAIDFEYDCNAESFGSPAQKKRIPKFFILVEGDGRDYPVSVGVDKDRSGDTRFNTVDLSTEQAEIGSFHIDDGTQIGLSAKYQPKRIRISGYAYYWQVILKRRAINNPIRFIGYTLSLRAKKL